ncbi:MAG: hypothetical protein A3B30_01845 [Candidatus Komeilibacteria bacterium RIFCSPLOWO2_01_FULL_52_15]|uniref:Nudix hydrolase domain-containing protein n=2 Tax=Candidatus Komeiliibacteriota TaxID=1817908 RepID=A0A1G2BU34_9BACT|nr:MAG: hypothetical protein A2677_04430 [Candidatus Komeilibacteria bacterium RIFCSPHIGHO2_01_FULL_52_14]OGY91757.1 MAG: hypothetical protein A3B30_01845 [Candidatus Komeilibacteria bacterium RIFCSPLOWO2_01_FULL_52_15]
MKRIFYKIINPFRRLYWFLVRPKTQGVKGVIFFNDKILMIRNSYTRGKYWTVPGGGIKRGETPLQAVRREVKEEVGIQSDAYQQIHTYNNIKEHKRDTVHVFITRVNDMSFRIDPSEILEARWFPVDNLPEHVPPTFNKYKPLLKNFIYEKN